MRWFSQSVDTRNGKPRVGKSIRDRFHTMAISFRDIVSILQSRMQRSHSIDALADSVISEA
jgi:hypothetical protein